MSGQGTSLALIGAFLLAHHLAAESDPATAFDLWERQFRPNVELNQALATDGMSTHCCPRRRSASSRVTNR
jgi:2-polyprenyl-6-methoxyphenol hydroxylase-like FAD-dependent oxidoreductase